MSVERISLVLADVNGQPGAITTDSSGRVVAAISLDMVEDRVHAMRTVTNPDKLGHVSVS
jgi:RNA polymerase sigma-70 factor (ECF subfamily)